VTAGHIAATHERFSGIRQVAPVCTPPNTCFREPTGVQIPNGISIGSGVFVRLSTVSDRQRYSVCNNTPHLHMYTAMRPNKKETQQHTSVYKHWCNINSLQESSLRAVIGFSNFTFTLQSKIKKHFSSCNR